MPNRIRVLVVDLDPRLARSLAGALPRRGPVSVSGPVADQAVAIDALTEGSADLVVVGLDRADGRGNEVVAAITEAVGLGRVLAASEQGGPDVAANALSAGASGVLPSTRDASLVHAFRRALDGELVLPVEELSVLVDRITSPSRGDAAGLNALGSLTPREREILQTLAAGASTADVAEAFGISPLTVQSHVKNILAKLGVHSKVEAVRIAWRHGLATTSRSSASTG
ncbi:MAG: response regulator transcription factor [Actinomycetota bacterium]|nr:response regulator transcription factor [Actinomycetota bacterium]